MGDDIGDFEDPIYDDESDEDHGDELNTLIWGVYEDDDAPLDQIFDMSQDQDFNNKIIFHEYQNYEEETPYANFKLILIHFLSYLVLGSFK